MEEMRIYVANLGKYNEGELVGAWFTPPVDFEEVIHSHELNKGGNDIAQGAAFTQLAGWVCIYQDEWYRIGGMSCKWLPGLIVHQLLRIAVVGTLTNL